MKFGSVCHGVDNNIKWTELHYKYLYTKIYIRVQNGSEYLQIIKIITILCRGNESQSVPFSQKRYIF